MLDVITFGSATADIFLKLKKGERLCLGRKVLVEDLAVFSGGGGTNVAAGLSNFGLKTAYCGKIGADWAGALVLKELRQFKVKTDLTRIDNKSKTALSVVVSPYGADRLALVYRGACHYLQKQELVLEKLKLARWFYLGPLREESKKLLPFLVEFAKKNKIKLAVNPSLQQSDLKKFLSDIALLILNEEEAEHFGGAGELRKKCKGIVAVTAGAKGSLVHSGKRIFRAGAKKNIKVVEKTGAGDAYAAGLLAGLLLKDDIEYAIKLARKNAEACLGQIGAKNGLLGQKDAV